MSRRSHRRGKAPARSKVVKERVGLVVLGALLAASLIVLYRVAFENLWTNKRLQSLEEENEALKNNCSGKTIIFTPNSECDEEWEHYGDKCYHFSTMKSSWDMSRMLCSEFRADLVKIDSEEEQSFLLNKLKDIMTHREDKFWIGLTDSRTEGTWSWVDGSPLDESLQFWWKNNDFAEPDNWTGGSPDGEDCARMGDIRPRADLNHWLDATCTIKQRCICAKPVKGRQ